MDTRAHWNHVYTAKGENDVSWFETRPSESIRMIEAAGLTSQSCVIDVGGGDSRLVDELAARGLTCLAVLDVSDAALERARTRLGKIAAAFTWIASDITGDWTTRPMDIWHDRAVFHFLTDPRDRAAYVRQVRRAVRPGGHVIVATFGPDGPVKCSGLDVVRYDAEALHDAFGAAFELVDHVTEAHETPRGTVQQFVYCYCKLSQA